MRKNYYDGSEGSTKNNQNKWWLNFAPLQDSFRHGRGGDVMVQMRTQFGLDRQNWCLLVIPKAVTEFSVENIVDKVTVGSNVDKAANLTTLDSWNLNGRDIILLSDTDGHDIW